MALGNAFGHLRLRARIRPQSADGDDVRRAVGRTVATVVEAMGVVLPDQAGTGLTPQSAAKAASDLNGSALSPAVSRSCAAPARPIE